MKDTYDAHREGIPWSSLPQTFRDAITVGRQIGFDYIWIDSLCIIQDDKADWLRESGRMGSIYEMADLTLAACHAADSSEGMFTSRPFRNPVVELPNFLEGSASGQGRVFASVRRETVEDTFPEYGPLNRRAWSTQEWLLSRRMVFYTKGTIMWSCKEITERENGERCFNISRNTRWKTVVEHYSERLLMFATDKLIALEGLRNEIQKKTGYTFISGIWLESLPDQLLWHVTEHSRPGEASNPLGLPTWTWAHVPTAVRFLPMHGAKSLCESVSVSQDSKTLTIRSRARRVAAVKSDLDPNHGQDETTRAILRDVSATHASSTESLACYVLDEASRPIGWVVYDEANSRTAETQDFCVQLMGRVSRRDEKTEQRQGIVTSTKLREYWVLVARPHPDGGGYSRVGVGKIYGLWWQNESVQQVVLR
ncbi:fungal specific transcription factor domain-containing protein [Purpureocillium lavendulum]|uniref:Fungal specific transcription factor domain-containing protein n=1 Tax=Purpureocillium lavendulum TaxID=1247861 RepID=A0AB34FST9_9HYPO|nr:fungal specific transcription factor domain-containing protein [Purpureocillium lavendulum]